MLRVADLFKIMMFRHLLMIFSQFNYEHSLFVYILKLKKNKKVRGFYSQVCSQKIFDVKKDG